MGTGARPLEHADGPAAFVGRDDDLQRLQRLLGRAAARTPTVLVVRGEVGVGKTRLLREFADRAGSSGALVLWGSCIALGTGELAYAPLIDALRRLVRGRGEERVRELTGSGYAELADLVLHAGDPGHAAGRGAQSRVFGAVLRMLDQLGAERPVVFVIEDLQWADPSTLDLFGYLARAATDERLLLVGSYRTTDLPPGHPLRTLVAELDLARLVQQLEVARFSRAELSTLLRNALDRAVTHDLVERTFELTDGNAFFVEEVLNSGVLTAARDHGPVALPGTVHDLLLPRFQLLGEDARDVMRVAATAGRRVSHRLIETVCELPRDRMLAALRECVDSQLLVTDPADDTYVFRHALVREVVHQSLIPGDRLRLHEAIALALSQDSQLSYAEQLTIAAELSYHWYEARAYPEALAAAVRAGHDASRLLAFRDAGRQFDRALEVWDRVPDAATIAGAPKYRLLCSAADAARWAGRTDRAVELARAATSEVDALTQPDLAGEVYERLGSFLWEAGDHGAAERAYTEAGALLVDAPPSAAAARVLAVRATAQVRQGHAADGLRLGREALALARSVNARAEEGRALNTVGIALTLLGDVEEGIATLDEALRIADTANQLEDLYRAYGNLVFALEHAGELDRAVAVAVEGLARARENGLDHTMGRGVLANNACAALVQLGRLDEASSILEQLVRDHPAAERIFPCLTNAEIAVIRGDFAAADQLLAEVRDAAASVGQPQIVGSVYAYAAETAVWRHHADVAARAVTDGLRAVSSADDQVVPLRLCALGLRNEADESLRRAALPGTARSGRTIKSSTMDSLVAEVDRRSDTDRLMPEVAALVLLCRAEQDRSGSTDRPPQWAQVAAAWKALKRPYLVAYARWREAEEACRSAMATRPARGPARTAHDRALTQARDAAREAHQRAKNLGAEPLRREIEALARGARIDLTSGEPETDRVPASAAPDAFGLTAREREVLALVCTGWSNRQIGRKLFITEKTAGVHVSNILSKLGVPKRGEAAAVAHRMRLLDEPGPG